MHRTYKAGFLYKFTAETIVNNLQFGAKFVEPSKKIKEVIIVTYCKLFYSSSYLGLMMFRHFPGVVQPLVLISVMTSSINI